MSKLLILCSTLLMTLSASAATPSACLSGPAENQFDCVQQEFKDSEQKMNSTYQKIIVALQKNQNFGDERNFVLENMSSRLRISQRSWLYFRAGECEMESFAKINKEHVVAAQLQCNSRMNQERTQQIEAAFQSTLK